MADYKQVSAFCYHCNKQVVSKKEEVDHKFWLIASLFSCGIFAIFWIIKMLTHNPPAMCSQCGLAIGNNPQMTNAGLPRQGQPGRTNFVPQNSDEATGKGLSKAAKAGVASIIGLVAMMFLCKIVGDVSSVANPKQAVTTSQTPQSAVTPQTTPSPIKQTKKGKGKEAPPTKQVEGYQMNNSDGTTRGYALTCFRQANELGQDIDFRARNFVFEKCIEYEGDGDTAKREAIYMIQQAR